MCLVPQEGIFLVLRRRCSGWPSQTLGKDTCAKPQEIRNLVCLWNLFRSFLPLKIPPHWRTTKYWAPSIAVQMPTHFMLFSSMVGHLRKSAQPARPLAARQISRVLGKYLAPNRCNKAAYYRASSHSNFRHFPPQNGETGDHSWNHQGGFAIAVIRYGC